MEQPPTTTAAGCSLGATALRESALPPEEWADEVASALSRLACCLERAKSSAAPREERPTANGRGEQVGVGGGRCGRRPSSPTCTAPALGSRRGSRRPWRAQGPAARAARAGASRRGRLSAAGGGRGIQGAAAREGAPRRSAAQVRRRRRCDGATGGLTAAAADALWTHVRVLEKAREGSGGRGESKPRCWRGG